MGSSTEVVVVCSTKRTKEQYREYQACEYGGQTLLNMVHCNQLWVHMSHSFLLLFPTEIFGKGNKTTKNNGVATE